MLKKVILSMLAIGGMSFAIGTFAGSTTIAVVDYVKVFKEAPQGKAKVDSLKAKLTPQMDALKEQQKGLVAKAKKLQQEEATMTKAEKAKKEKSFLKLQQDFQTKVMSVHKDEVKKEQSVVKNFETNVKRSIKAVAKEGSYDLVLNSQAVAYRKDSNDITDKVVKIMKRLK